MINGFYEKIVMQMFHVIVVTPLAIFFNFDMFFGHKKANCPSWNGSVITMPDGVIWRGAPRNFWREAQFFKN